MSRLQVCKSCLRTTGVTISTPTPLFWPAVERASSTCTPPTRPWPLAMASPWRCVQGAQLADLEFYQFHPTALAVPGTFLISEAVRGDGAVLLDANGRRFMQHIHAGAELAPRDVVARGIARQMAAQNGQPVMLDATGLGASFLAQRFPTIDAACRARGLDWSRTPIPVTPAAHYWMGGVRTDIWGRTSVPGLFAVGEVACTGVHGANRLASNSLLESLVFAWRCAAFLLDEDVAKGTATPSSVAVSTSDSRCPCDTAGAATPTRARCQAR